MNQFYKNEKNGYMHSIPEGDCDKRLDTIASRLYFDTFYQDIFEYGLEVCKDICSYAEEEDIEIQFLALRGSLVTGTITPDEDIDIVINSKSRSSLFRYVEKEIEKFIYRVKERCPNLTRKHPISIYLPRTPKDPSKRSELFIEDPVDLEIWTTQAEQPIASNVRRSVYKFQKDCLKPIVNTTLDNPSINSIRAMEITRKIGMEEYRLDRNTTHNSTIISQARCVGFMFWERDLSFNNIIKIRNKLIRERFEEIITEIYYRLGL